MPQAFLTQGGEIRWGVVVVTLPGNCAGVPHKLEPF